MSKRIYLPPVIRSEPIELGVFGNYGEGGGNVDPFHPVRESTRLFETPAGD